MFNLISNLMFNHFFRLSCRIKKQSGSDSVSGVSFLPALPAADVSVPSRRRLRLCIGVLASVLALTLLCSCSGTGSMYTPDDIEDAAAAGTTAGAGASAEAAALQAGEEAEDPSAQEEDPRTRLAWLKGTGSDLYPAQTVDSYYHFTLNDVSLQLPCSLSSLTSAGWELSPSGKEGEATALLVDAYSYEFFDAVPTDGSFGKKGDGARRIRLCLGNDGGEPAAPDQCTVFGISVSEDSGISFKTAFEAELGSPLSDLTAVFGTEASILTQTKYSDGTCTARYQFSNGLIQEEKIPVLAEAEEKDLAEMMVAQTGSDGSTITSLSLYYFRISK